MNQPNEKLTTRNRDEDPPDELGDWIESTARRMRGAAELRAVEDALPELSEHLYETLGRILAAQPGGRERAARAKILVGGGWLRVALDGDTYETTCGDDSPASLSEALVSLASGLEDAG